MAAAARCVCFPPRTVIRAPLAGGKGGVPLLARRSAGPTGDQPTVRRTQRTQTRCLVPLGPSMSAEWRGRGPLCFTQGCPLVPPHIALRVADAVESMRGRSRGGGGSSMRASTPAGPDGAQIFFDWNPSRAPVRVGGGPKWLKPTSVVELRPHLRVEWAPQTRAWNAVTGRGDQSSWRINE